jgi:hypothetical protein
MNRFFIIALLLILISTVSAYSQNIDWLQCFGGSDRDYAFSIVNSNDGALVVVGSSMSANGDVSNNYGQTDCWIVKLDTLGNILWERNYGGSGTESACSIQPTSDHGYIFSGATNSYDGDIWGQHGYYDVWGVKIDSTGEIQWQNCLGGSKRESAYCVSECHDGGYILAGYTLSEDGDISSHIGDEDAWVVKLDSSGELEWEKTGYPPKSGQQVKLQKEVNL